MLTFATPITIPNLNRAEVEAVTIRGKLGVGYVYTRVIGAGAAQPSYPTNDSVFELSIANGACQGIRVKAAPTGYGDRVETFTSTLPTGLTDMTAQYRAGANDAAGRRNVENWLVANGLLPAGAVA